MVAAGSMWALRRPDWLSAGAVSPEAAGSEVPWSAPALLLTKASKTNEATTNMIPNVFMASPGC